MVEAQNRSAEIRVRKTPAAPAMLGPTRGRRAYMREWHKPTVEEMDTGMEVTSYLPAELDRA